MGKAGPTLKPGWDILAPEETGDSEAKLRPSFKEERVVGWLRSMPHSSNRHIEELTLGFARTDISNDLDKSYAMD